MTSDTDAVEASGAGEAGALQFVQLAKNEIKQDAVHDFVAHTTDGINIALLGSQSELITLELSVKVGSFLSPFPYTCSTYEHGASERPLDALAQQVDLSHIYEQGNVLDAQQLSLEPVYVALCSLEVPLPQTSSANWSPQPLPDGRQLLALLNSQGALLLLAKTSEQTHWQQLKALDVAATLRDVILPPYEVPPSDIKSFKQYQAYMDRSWITAQAWRRTKAGEDHHELLLGTAAGSLLTLTLSRDACQLLRHRQFHSLLGRICYMRAFEHLLLVGDANGLVHLYSNNETENDNETAEDEDDDGLSLLKPLWLRPDRMGLQYAEMTYSKSRDCYYIACCKAAHLLIWSLPKSGDSPTLEAQLYVGGIKITALCAWGSSSYVLSTARSELFRVQVSQAQQQLSFSKQRLQVEDLEHFQPLGLCSSRHGNLLTLLLARSEEYVMTGPVSRHQALLHVGKLQSCDALQRLSEEQNLSQPMNHYVDLLAELRLDIFNERDLPKYISFASLPASSLKEEEEEEQQLASEAQLKQLQLKYHVLDALLQLRLTRVQHSVLADGTKAELAELLAALTLTHLRLRLQQLSKTLQERQQLTPFQRLAARCMLDEIKRLQEQQQQPDLSFEQQFERLSKEAVKEEPQQQLPGHRCSVSFTPLATQLDQRFCSLCGRQALLDEAPLLELYASGSQLICPYCRGLYMTETAVAAVEEASE